MKRTIIVVALVALVGWAVFDFVSEDDTAQQANEATNTAEVQDNEVNNEANNETEHSEENKTTAKEDELKAQAGSVLRQMPEGLTQGMRAPDFELTTLSGETVHLSDYRGERVMLNFWATWCGPCRAEMPDMQKFHEETDIVILAVNLTNSQAGEAEEVPKFLDEHGITFDVLMDTDDVVNNLYQIKPIPTNFLINSDGSIHNVAYGALNYDLMIQEYEKMH